MNYRMSANYEEEILRLNSRVKQLMAALEKATSENTTLYNENRGLKVHCNSYHEKYHDIKEKHFKCAFSIKELEDSRDKLLEANQRQKLNINKYLDTIRRQGDRLRQLENSAKAQTMRASLNRNAIGGPTLDDPSLREVKLLKEENDRLRKESQEIQEKLNESYNLIDELEFELETLDFVEADRDHLQQELKDLRTEKDELFNRLTTLKVGGDEEAPVHDNHDYGAGSQLSTIQPSFAAFAIDGGDNDKDDHPDGGGVHADSTDNKEEPAGAHEEEQMGTGSSSDEFKKRRQELHKRLEILHQRQQIDL